MNSSLTVGPSVSLTLTCSSEHESRAAEPMLYRPGDLIPAFAELHKHRTFEALSLHGSLVGETRVWTHPADQEHIFQTLIHTHLNQSVGFSHALPLLSNAGVGKAVVLPLTFVLPELSMESKGANSNGRMPPSCELGSLYVDPWGRTHMQPLIEYSLQVTLRYRLTGETAIRTISTKHKIKVTTAPHCDPPPYSRSISEVKASVASADVRRSRFTKPFALLRIAMAEPAPVVGNGFDGKCQTTGQLQLTWETSSEAHDEFELGKRSASIEYRLQARTRFGARAIGPDSKATDEEARPNKRVETTFEGTFEVRAMDRDDVHLTGSDGRRCHTGTILIPVQIADGAIPTFSHGLASRDYVLVVKVELQGLQHKAISIRVPVQVCESLVETKCNSPQTKSSIYADMLSSEARLYHAAAIADYALQSANAFQVLPKYEDHRYSSAP